MSALPPKADIGTQLRNVRFVPTADLCTTAILSLIRSPRRRDWARLDHSIGATGRMVTDGAGSMAASFVTDPREAF
jgi:hypothetical protein